MDINYSSIFFIRLEEFALNTEQTLDRKRILPWIIYLIFFAVLNETVFNVSTPRIAEQFSLSPSGVGWVMIIFLIFFGIGSMIYGRLSDIFSLKRLIIIGIIVYSIGSLTGFILQFSYPLVILARAIQGAGASAIPALMFVIAARYIKEDERGKVFGLITSTVSLGIGLGPIVGGYVAGYLNWSYLFLIPLLMLVSIPFLKKELPDEPRRPGRVDIKGAILVALTVGSLIIYMNISAWYFIIIFMILLAASIIYMRKTPDAFIQPSIFKNAKFRNGVTVGFIIFSTILGIIFLIPLMLHGIYGLDTKHIGFILFPGAISSVIFGPIGGSLADKKGSRIVMLFGLALLFASLIIMSLMINISVIVIAIAMLLTYVGFSFFQIAIINSVSMTLGKQETGVGMGLFNLASVISGAVGIALVGKILDGKLLDFKFFPNILQNSYSYSNILLVYSIIIILAGILYLRNFRNPIIL
jgi:MFS transporter, DHA2 family, metal-tetracycline-proton antiporter